MLFYDFNGGLCSEEAANKLYRHRYIATDYINGLRISTVYLMTNHNKNVEPVEIFETVVLGKNIVRRYSNIKDAIAGHKEIVNENR